MMVLMKMMALDFCSRDDGGDDRRRGDFRVRTRPQRFGRSGLEGGLEWEELGTEDADADPVIEPVLVFLLLHCAIELAGSSGLGVRHACQPASS